MNKRRYDLEMDRLIEGFGFKPTLLLHSCCAPCSSAVLEKLCEHFQITVFYYNPNITELEEYRYRTDEVQRLIREMDKEGEIRFLEGPYEPELFFEAVRGMEDLPEGGERCRVCFEQRLKKSAQIAAEENFDYFTTTLTISPMKNAALLNSIGEEAAKEFGSVFLPSDFKKKNGFKRSTELSDEYHLYRQDYCGCIFSKLEAEERRMKKSE